MNASSTSSTPGNVGASTASSSNSSPYGDYVNGGGNQRIGSSTRQSASTSGPGTSNGPNLSSSSKTSGPTSSLLTGLDSTDHIQRLTQMTNGVGLSKNDNESGTSNSVITAGLSSSESLYQSAATAAYIQQCGGWPNPYAYPQFNQPMAPGVPFAGWPQYPGHWQNYTQTKKGRQTYQRYQTSVLESKFQQSSYVSKKQREELRLQTNLTDRQIKIWFQNRRMKAKKEKNRCEDQSEHSTLLPSNNSSKSLNNSLSSLNGSGPTANSSSMMSGANLGMIGGQHLIGEEALQGLMDQEDAKQLKLSSLHHGMIPNASAAWAMPHSVQAAAGAMLNNDQLNQWNQFLPQSAHQSSQYPYNMPYPICPPNI